MVDRRDHHQQVDQAFTAEGNAEASLSGVLSLQKTVDIFLFGLVVRPMNAMAGIDQLAAKQR